MEPNDFLVCVRCFTYNHAEYIHDTMDGFCIQQTNFPYVCVIIDDASSDGEPDVIMKYLGNHFNLDDMSVVKKSENEDYSMSFAQHKENRNCYFAVFFLKYNHYIINKSKLQYFQNCIDNIEYHALCEGDDYWIDPLKLCKEVEYLNNHKDKSLVYTNCNVLFHEENRYHKNVFTTGYLKNALNYKDFLLYADYLAPCTWLSTRRFWEIKRPSSVIDGTLYIALYLFHSDSIGYIDDTTATYRVVHEGASHSRDLSKRYDYFKNVIDTYKMFIEKDSTVFSKEELEQFYYRKYRHLLPYALAFNDNEILKDIWVFTKPYLDLKGRMMLSLSKFSIVRKIIYKVLYHRISHGL